MIDKSHSKIKSAEVNLLKEQLARALADYDNLRKRTEAERLSWAKFASQGILIRLLPVLDILKSANSHLKDKGLDIALSEFKKILEEEGLVEVNPKRGEAFNPSDQEAIESLEGGKKGTVAEVVLPGWKFVDGPVVRIAKVKVFGPNIEKKEELEKEIARGDYM